jgi:hypothetical protein
MSTRLVNNAQSQSIKLAAMIAMVWPMQLSLFTVSGGELGGWLISAEANILIS